MSQKPSSKPSYLGLLNAVALAETAAHEYLEAWIAVTPSDDVRAVLQCVSAREGEHGKAFAKRINELGYTLRPKEDPSHADRVAFAGSSLSDLEKMEKLGLGRLDTGDKPDVFDGFFKDHSIDVGTGELLGRYIAEERDSARLLRSCYEQLCTAAGTTAAVTPAAAQSGDRLAALESKVDAICAAVEDIRGSLGAKPAPARKPSTNGKPKARRTKV
jgi:hypothetical protein